MLKSVARRRDEQESTTGSMGYTGRRGSRMRAVVVAMEERKTRAREVRRPNPATRVSGEDRRVGREVSAPAIGLSDHVVFV